MFNGVSFPNAEVVMIIGKKFILAAVFFLLSAGEVSAFAIIGDAGIKQAQEYGMMHYQEETAVFCKPWMVYEEKSDVLDDSSERAYIYTPYYLVAMNARDRLVGSQTINIEDGQAVMEGYQDSLPFCLVLFVKEGTNIQNRISASIRQNDKSVDSYASSLQELVVVKTKVIKETLPTLTPSEGKEKPDKDPVENEGKPVEPSDKDKPKPKDKTVAPGKGKSGESANKGKTSDKTTETGKAKPTGATGNAKEAEAAKPGEGSTAKPKTPEPIVIEKTVPALYRLQVFVYFDLRELDTNASSTLRVNIKGEDERNFHMKFSELL